MSPDSWHLSDGQCFGTEKTVPENPNKGISSDRSQVVYRGNGFYSPVVSGDNETDTQYLNTEVLIQDQESENQDSDSEDQEIRMQKICFQMMVQNRTDRQTEVEKILKKRL